MKGIALKVFQLKTFYLPLLAGTLVVAGIFGYYASIKALTIFPNNSEYGYYSYTDAANGGNSKVIAEHTTDSLYAITFKLNKDFHSPYVGFTVGQQEQQIINASKYNELSIGIAGENIDRIGIAIYTPPYKNNNVSTTTETLYYSFLNIANKQKLYKIPLTQFQHPDWWEDLNHIPKEERNPKIDSILHFNIGSAFSQQIGNEKTIKLYSLALTRNNTALFTTILLVFAIVMVFTYAINFYLLQRNSKVTEITVAYKPLEVVPKQTSDDKSITYINENYENTELTLEMIAAETGSTTRSISNSIHDKFGCNFKTYLNRIRINESKRLLLETDLNIGEIAFKVGFNNQSHFNRVFKKELDLSPTEFRVQHKS